MKEIVYFDRVAQKLEKEKVYGQFFLSLLYSSTVWKKSFSFFVLPLVTRVSFFSRFYGWLQKSSLSRYKIRPFISKFSIDKREFLDPVDSFRSFNDFFIRKLNLRYRPVVKENAVAALPADARYLVFPNIKETDHIWVKGQHLSLKKLLKDALLAKRYEEGALVIARLCPVDYHRFHFPCEGTPGKAKEIRGPLFSVNPIALAKRLRILSENKRMITSFKTREFGTVLIIEVGATYVGTIHQTYTPKILHAKGAEKGYFSFGGSCLILLFEPRTIQFEQDLLEYSSKMIEVRGLMGQPLGTSLRQI